MSCLTHAILRVVLAMLMPYRCMLKANRNTARACRTADYESATLVTSLIALTFSHTFPSLHKGNAWVGKMTFDITGGRFCVGFDTFVSEPSELFVIVDEINRADPDDAVVMHSQDMNCPDIIRSIANEYNSYLRDHLHMGNTELLDLTNCPTLGSSYKTAVLQLLLKYLTMCTENYAGLTKWHHESEMFVDIVKHAVGMIV